MAVDSPVPVPEKKISSVDIVGFGAGLWLNGSQDAPNNSLTDSKDIELTSDAFITPRRVLVPFLPDTIESVFQILPVNYNGTLYFFTADHNQMVFCQEGDSGWTPCDTVGVAAVLTTALTGANNDLTFTANVLGTDGNAVSIAYVNAGASKSLVVNVSGNAISVQLATSSGSVITSTGSTVLAAILASTAASALVSAALASGNTGAGLVTALSATHLAGGSGTNIIITNNGGKPELIRVQNNVLLLNGTNGNKLCYADLTTPGFPVVKYDLVDDPASALTSALTNLTNSGSFFVYYAYSYSNAVGETALSPILSQPLNLDRDHWGDDVASPGSITLTRPDFGSEPAGSQNWNLYVALAPTTGTIQDSDMLQIATKLDLNSQHFTDDGTLSINLGAIAPSENGTDGPRVDHGIVEDGNPILYGDFVNSENIWIGGGGINAMSFTTANGGYKAQPEQGTNFTPSVIIGFRNGTGQPSLTVLYSNTEGLSKQSVLEQQNVTYGDQSFSVWSVTEQHYGAAGVAATNSAINYNGKLLFLSTDGFMSMNTQPLRQNVIATDPISVAAIDSYVRTIKTSAMSKVVGAGWDNKFMWTVPNAGFDDPKQILIYDDNNKGAFYAVDVPAQWIGVVSPLDAPAFVYVVQDNHSYKLAQGTGTFDVKGGVNVPFSTSATGALIGLGGTAHNSWQANVQVMFYVLGLVGSMTIGVTYRNQNGTLKTKSRVIQGADFVPSGAGGWGDPEWTYSNFPAIDGWSGSPMIDASKTSAAPVDIREPIIIDDLMSEAQWFYVTDVGFNDYKFRAVSFEGISLGVRPDLQ